MSEIPTLRTELELAELDVNEAQRMLDHTRKTIIGPFPPVKAYLNRRQHEINVRRVKIEAGKRYIADAEK
jgi:hypothetical protein